MARLDLSREAPTYAPALTDVPTLSPMERTVVENTWRGRMLNEHASARVFAGLVPQLMAAEVAPRHQAAVAEMVAEELHHARLCAGVLHALGAEPAGELPALAPLPVHADAASPLEALMRNVLSVSCLSETVAVALIDAERRALHDSPLAGVLKRILGDEVGHARLGWTLLAEHPLDDALRQRLSDYLRVAFAHLEAHELANLSPVAAPAGAMALGACDGVLARDIFHATVEEVVIPGLERHGLDARAAWESRPTV
ncbi:MAG: ferritin-like domain-containing protein [Myxococcales bacterium]|nr:ferritin-like domain-containing protein [Myxococcales bacterium]